jgi:predicted O-methyltransferase YrrM
MFDFAERKGIHILPVHYYTPIPTRADIDRKRRRNHMAGIDLNLETGIRRAALLLDRYQTGIENLFSGNVGFDPANAGFHPLDAAVLYATVREARPARIVEIGSGMSTFAISAAIRDGEISAKFTCIEPFLPTYLKNNLLITNEVIESSLQDVPIEIFEQLSAGDILFIDSTHVARFDSDVVYEILEILPILKPGVIVHVHDIFFPDDYPIDWISKHRYFWNEQYMLQAFLSMNREFKIEIPIHAIKSFLPYLEHSAVEPASLWLRRI